MSDSTEAFGVAVADLEAPQDTLQQLRVAVKYRNDLEDQTDGLTADLEALKAEQRKVIEVMVPELLDAAGVDKIEVDGWEVSTKADFYGGLPKDRFKPETAIQWLDAHDGGGLSQTDVVAHYGRSQKDEAARAAEMMAQAGGTVEVIEAVHPMSLKKFARDRMEGGESLEPEILGLHYVRQAKFKQTRKR